MARPKFISADDISRWSNVIDNDPNMPEEWAKSPIVREVCLAGLWLCEELEKLSCPESLIVRIQYSAGKLSFGKDAWEIHQKFLDGYRNSQ
jgi:hypothetical protein